MDWNTRFVAAVVSVFAGLSVAIVGLWWAVGRTAPPLLEPPPPNFSASASTTQKTRTYLRGTDSMRARARISDLQRELARSHRLLELKNEKLDAVRQELADVRGELKQSEEFADLLVAAGMTDGMPGDTTAGTTAGKATPDAIAQTNPAELLALESPDEVENASPSGGIEGIRDSLLGFELTEPEPQTMTEPARPAQHEAALELAEAQLQAQSEVQFELLRSIGADGLQGLILALENQSPSVRSAACDAIAQLGPNGTAAHDALRTRLNDADEQVRIRATAALASIRE